MKKLIPALCLTVLLFSCRKNGPGGGNDNGFGHPDSTIVPASENVNTEIIGYVTNDQNGLIPSTYFYLPGNANTTSFNIGTDGLVTTPTVTTDRYHTRTLIQGGGWSYIPTENTFALTPAAINYVRIKMLNRTKVGSVRNDAGGTYSLPNGGSITYGINTFFQTPTQIWPGYFGPEITSGIYVNYFNPEDKEFARYLPSYLAGDDGSQRSFLKSYGAISLVMYSDASSGDNIDFFNNEKADLKLPIPASMQAGAPDSVSAWHLVNGIWTKAGSAMKSGNFYIAKIGKTGAWTFAQPQKGVYLNISARTDSNAILANTAIRIKSNNRVIAESRTDNEGNAICFVPTHDSLVAEVVPDERVYSTHTHIYPIGIIKEASAITVKIPANTPDLTTVIANVFNCNGQPVASGMAKIKFFIEGLEYIVPVKNGRMAAALWIYASNDRVTVQVTDNATGTQSDPVNLVLFTGNTQLVNLYMCQKPSMLYCNYSVDNKLYQLTDDAASASVYMTASKVNQYAPVTIKTSSNGLGLNFTTSAIYGVSVSNSWLVTDLMVNGTTYIFDAAADSKVSITRYDDTNGYIEGCIMLYFRDNANGQHHLQANFKVKRTF